MRWRYGETNPIVMPVDSASVIEIGDLVWLDTDNAKPASDVADQLTEAANQEYFHDRFAGVAMQRSASGDTEPIRVATTGVFEFDCASATYEVGDLIGSSEAASGTELETQKVVAVGSGNENLAIGRCTKRVASADTRVLVDAVSTVMRGGPQAAA
jgi:D-alanyl-D-alanine carboxypeptidase